MGNPVKVVCPRTTCQFPTDMYIFLNLTFNDLFFVCMCVSAGEHAQCTQMPQEVRRGYPNPGSWHYSAGSVLSTGPSLQPQNVRKK